MGHQGTLGAPRDVGGIRGIVVSRGIRGCQEVEGVSGVHWGLAGSVGAQGPAGVQEASGDIGGS